MNERMTAEKELELFFEDRSLHYEKVILPAINAGRHVFCDRWASSTYAYQIEGRQKPGLKQLFTSLCEETLCDENGIPKVETHIIYLHVTPEEGLRRKALSKDGICTKFDKESVEFHRRFEKGFKAFIGEFHGRFFESFVIIDTEASHEKVVKQKVFKEVHKIIS